MASKGIPMALERTINCTFFNTSILFSALKGNNVDI